MLRFHATVNEFIGFVFRAGVRICLWFAEAADRLGPEVATMGTVDPKDEGQMPDGDTRETRDPWGGFVSHISRRRQQFGDRFGRRSGTLAPALLALGGLGLVALFLEFTSPGQTIDDVANLNVTVDAPPGSIATANAYLEVRLNKEGGASATVEVFFVCEASANLTIEISSSEASRINYSPESPGPRLSNSLMSSPTLKAAPEGLKVSGGCGKNKPVNVPITVEFPARTVAVPLERGKYAFGIDLFIGNFSNSLSKNGYSIGLVTPEGALLTEAFDAQARTFNRATWEATSQYSLPAYGTYGMPAQVAQARLWENVILLLLGAMVGIALEAALRRARR